MRDTRREIQTETNRKRNSFSCPKSGEICGPRMSTCFHSNQNHSNHLIADGSSEYVLNKKKWKNILVYTTTVDVYISFNRSNYLQTHAQRISELQSF